jgi:hypothetical protein
VVVIVLAIGAVWLLPEKEPSRSGLQRADRPTAANKSDGTTANAPKIAAPSQAVPPEAPSDKPDSAPKTSEGGPAESPSEDTGKQAADRETQEPGQTAVTAADQSAQPSAADGAAGTGSTMATDKRADQTSGSGPASATTTPGDSEKVASAGQTDSSSSSAPATASGSETVQMAEPGVKNPPQNGVRLEDGQMAMVTPPKQPVPSATPAVTAPSFDVVRISQQCTAVIAGRAEPGAQVTVWDGEQPLGQVIADPRGEWVLVVSEPMRGGSRQLKLIAIGASGTPVESDSVVVIAVPDCTAPAPEKEKESVIAVLTPKEGGASQVLQAPESDDKAEDKAGDSKDLALKSVDSKDLALKSVDYDEKGEVVLSGKAEPGKNVQAYVDNKPVGAAKADEEGRWEVKPDEVIQPGVHKLRVDQVEQGGKVAARIELPFSRASAAQIVLAPGHVIVQPGNSLWRIARRTYGHGVRFTVIYQANQEQIRDPNLIYPGQIFSLPRVN